MRSISLAGLVVLAIVGQSGAQTYPLQATVTGSNLYVWSGESYSFYATSALRLGDQVTVLGPAPDNQAWLRIKPPAGSFSWIDTTAVRDGVVTRDDVPVYVGSQVFDGPPSVSRVRANRGTQVIAMPNARPTMPYNGIQLMMIAPLPSEVRYIAANTISPVRSPVTVQTTLAQPAVPGAPAVQIAHSPTTSSQYITRLWDEAERADARHDPDQAITIYDKLSQIEPDETRRHDAANRAYWRRRGYYGNFGAAVAQTAATSPAGAPTAPVTPSYTPSYTAYPASQPGLQYTWGRETSTPLAPAPVQAANYTRAVATATVLAASAPSPTPTSTPQWSPPGRLRLAPFPYRGQTCYALEDFRGDVLLYAAPVPSVNLESYRDRVVYIGGPITYDGVLRKNVMQVTAVSPPR